MKMLNRILNAVIGAFIGVFIGNGVYVLKDYKAHPDFYAAQSAPWYASILYYGIATAAVVAVALLVKLIIRRKIK